MWLSAVTHAFSLLAFSSFCRKLRRRLSLRVDLCVLCVSLALSMILSSEVSASPPKTANFALLDQHGLQHELRKYGDSKALVLMTLSSSCSDSIDALPKYRLLRSTWERQGIDFLGLAASLDDNRESIQSLDELYQIDLPILLDSSQLVAESLDISTIGQILVIDPDRRRVLYRGGVEGHVMTASKEYAIRI